MNRYSILSIVLLFAGLLLIAGLNGRADGGICRALIELCGNARSGQWRFEHRLLLSVFVGAVVSIKTLEVAQSRLA